jgi:large subunit ribosomal protein L19
LPIPVAAEWGPPDRIERLVMNSLMDVEKSYLRQNLPEFRAGDTVRVQVKVKEGDKERLQAFQGVVVARKGSGTREMFTVRKISGGIGVERIFPLHAPVVDSVELVRRGRVRRSKLYYLRNLKGKAARIEERRDEAAAPARS